jgi:hypothetical protein
VFTRLLSKPLSTILLLASFLLIMSSCGLPGAVGKQQPISTTSPTFTGQVTPVCQSGSACVIPTGVPNTRPLIDTWDNIHLFQSFDYHIQDPASVAKYYDFIWGAAANKVAAYRAANPNITLSYYISFFRDSGVFGNSNAHQGLSYWQSVHPDWILYQCDRTTPAYEDGQTNVIPFDFTNPAVIQWEVQTYALPASRNGYDALAADNVNLENMIGACGHYQNGQWIQRYTGQPNDPQWRADVATWITQMQQALHALAHPLLLVPNLGIGSVPLNDPMLQQVVQHSDAILDEGGFTGYGDRYVMDNQWVQKVQFIENVQAQGKAYYIGNEFSQSTLDGSGALTNEDIDWALASYLMCKQHTASVFISPAQDYGRSLLNNSYAAAIGSPRGNMYASGGLYWRDYTQAVVVVNPSSTMTYTAHVSGTYTDLNGNPVQQTVTLPPHSGMVLLF